MKKDSCNELRTCIATAIRTIYIKAGVPIQQAYKSGAISQTHLGRILNEKVDAKASTIEKIVTAAGMNLSDFNNALHQIAEKNGPPFFKRSKTYQEMNLEEIRTAALQILLRETEERYEIFTNAIKHGDSKSFCIENVGIAAGITEREIEHQITELLTTT